jgi:hypothetical protein
MPKALGGCVFEVRRHHPKEEVSSIHLARSDISVHLTIPRSFANSSIFDSLPPFSPSSRRSHGVAVQHTAAVPAAVNEDVHRHKELV